MIPNQINSEDERMSPSSRDNKLERLRAKEVDHENIPSIKALSSEKFKEEMLRSEGEARFSFGCSRDHPMN